MSKTVHFDLSLVMPANAREAVQFEVVAWLQKQISAWNKNAREHIGFANEENFSIEGSIVSAYMVLAVKSGKGFRTEFRPAWQFTGQTSKRKFDPNHGLEGQSVPVPLMFYQQLRDNLKKDKRSNPDLRNVALKRQFSYSEKESLLYLNIGD